MKPVAVLVALAACGAPGETTSLECYPVSVETDAGYVVLERDGGPVVCPKHPEKPEDCGPGCVGIWLG